MAQQHATGRHSCGVRTPGLLGVTDNAASFTWHAVRRGEHPGATPAAVRAVVVDTTVGELRAPERVALGARYGTVLLLPLVSPDGSWVGLLTVTLRRRQGFSRGARRAYLTLATPVTLALENLRLVEQARRAGLIGERQHLAHEIHDSLAKASQTSS